MKPEYRRAERILYQYPRTLQQYHAAILERHALETSGDVNAQSYKEYHASVGQVRDPAAEHVNRILNLDHKIERLEHTVKLIQDIEADYTHMDERGAIKLQILRLYYFEGESMVAISESLGINYRTLYRRRQEVVHDLIRFQEKLSKKVRNLL